MDNTVYVQNIEFSGWQGNIFGLSLNESLHNSSLYLVIGGSLMQKTTS
jgi:hypothetical protein